MKVFLRDINPVMVRAWETMFRDEDDIHISQGDIFGKGKHLTADAIVSPANSFGFMDGGIDLTYSEVLGWDVQKELQKEIHRKGGETLVGQAVLVRIVSTEISSNLRYVISAPTMRVPMNVAKTVNAYLAFKASLNLAGSLPKQIKSILCPGLGTAVGEMPPYRCAVQMKTAWNEYRAGTPLHYPTMRAATDIQRRLCNLKEPK